MTIGLLVRFCGLSLIALVVALAWIYWTPQSSAPTGPPQWQVHTIEDGGHHAILARLDAVQGRNWAGKPYQLVLRCMDRKTPNAYVDWATLISVGSPPLLRWQLDQGNAIRERWLTSLDGATTFAHDPRALIEALHTHQQLTLQLHDQQGKAHQAVFDLGDADRVLTPLRKDCGLG